MPLLLVVIAGCGPSESTVVGKYNGEALNTASAGTVATNLMKGMATSMSLEIKPDKTFHMVATLVPIDGKWTMSGDTITLTPEKVLGFGSSDAPVSTTKTMTFKVKNDVLEPVGDGGEKRFRFVRAKADAQLP